MNLKEEILNVTETGVSPSTGVTFPWVRPWDAEDIAESYAKEKAWEAWKVAIITAPAVRGLYVETPESLRNRFEMWWEGNK